MIERIVHAVTDASARGTALRIVGSETWRDAGRPTRAVERLDLAQLTGIVEYEPGDLTLTARAGTTLSEIEVATRVNSQFLTLDPYGAPNGTLGATLATASYGPLSHAFGGPRDAALGLEFVTGDGRVVRGGGRVVKNVAGFDLTRLLVGSWGTLGVITEVSVRLRALPDVDESFALPLPADASALAATIAALRAAPIAPWCAELVCMHLARDLALEPRAVILLRLAGNAESVAAQKIAVAALGQASSVPFNAWERLRNFERIPPAPVPAHDTACLVARFSSRPSNLVETWMHALAVASTGEGRAHATLSRGVARVKLVAPAPSLRGALRLPFGGTTIFEQLPAALWSELAPAADDAIAFGLRAKFDPRGVLNPGILGAR